jgi:hypothetical protein
VTGDMFGATNPTCDDSLNCTVIVTMRWVKCRSRERRAQATWIMKRPDTNSHQSHAKQQGRLGADPARLARRCGAQRRSDRVFATACSGSMAACSDDRVAVGGGQGSSQGAGLRRTLVARNGQKVNFVLGMGGPATVPTAFWYRPYESATTSKAPSLTTRSNQMYV